MEWLAVTASLYQRALLRSAELGLRNWPVFATALIYSMIMAAAAVMAAALGLVGGFLMSLVWAACASSFLYLIEMIVRTSKVSLDDFKRSFTAYIWDVLGVAFIAWLFFRFLTPALLQLPQGFVVLVCLQIAAFVFFNAVPELIYLGHYTSLGILSESYRFISANWIEWLPLAVVTLFIYSALPSIHRIEDAWIGIILTPVFYLLMVMRGLLFLELHGSTYRSRRFKYRTGG